jgi:two-component system sensor histidine kinase PilS (NtrC family)
MLGRLGAVTLLLGGTALLALGETGGFSAFTPRFVLWLIVATYAISLVLALSLSRTRRVSPIAQVQTVWDLLLTTMLVYVGGGISSGFTFLYGTSVLLAAIVLGPRAAQLTCLASIVLYVALGIMVTNGVIPHPPDQPPERYLLRPADATFAILVNIFGLLLVAYLAMNLAGRVSFAGGRLRAAAGRAADLARLNADIIRSMASGLITTSSSGEIQTLNPAALEIFRATSESMVGRGIRSFFLLDTQDSAQIQRTEAEAVRPDGTRFPVGYSKTPLVDRDGQRNGDLYLFQDLTELRELRLAAERAERLAALGRLSAALAHEIRNPLGSISGSVQLVRDVPELGSEDRRLLGIVLSEVDRLNGLVTTMLQVGRPRTPERRSVDLVALTQDLVDVARRDLRHRDADVRFTHGQASVCAWIDPDQMRQVVWNLLANALAHAPNKTTVEIHVEADGAWASWTISDQGPGVPVEARAHLFDMFYSKRPHGIGLGLALVDQLMRAHGGAIEVLDREGAGAVFRVRVPSPPATQTTATRRSA